MSNKKKQKTEEEIENEMLENERAIFDKDEDDLEFDDDDDDFLIDDDF